jgi:hypothetical protein
VVVVDLAADSVEDLVVDSVVAVVRPVLFK